MANYIAYTRVSTSRQGLGLDAQTAIINAYVQQHGGTIIASYSEKESGKDASNRKQLQQAIAHAKKTRAVLLVAKLDRLSRNIADIFMMKKDKKLTFEVCDMDATDTLTLGIFATLAQKERELISERTKAALAALKAKGVKLGNPNAATQIHTVRGKGCERRKEMARENDHNRHAYDAIRLMGGTLQSKCDYLNAHGYTTSTGYEFKPMQVRRLIAMYEPQQ